MPAKLIYMANKSVTCIHANILHELMNTPPLAFCDTSYLPLEAQPEQPAGFQSNQAVGMHPNPCCCAAPIAGPSGEPDKFVICSLCVAGTNNETAHTRSKVWLMIVS
jgi:hypothetical protein